MWSKVIQIFHSCKVMVTTVSSKDSIPSVHGCFMLQKAGGPSCVPGLGNSYFHAQASSETHFYSLT